jgi:hypothetical protein
VNQLMLNLKIMCTTLNHRLMLYKVNWVKLSNYRFNFESLGYLPVGKIGIIQHTYHITIIQISSRHHIKNIEQFHTWEIRVVVPSANTLSWDACSMIHLETHSPMHLKWTKYIDRSGTKCKLGMDTITLIQSCLYRCYAFGVNISYFL